MLKQVMQKILNFVHRWWFAGLITLIISFGVVFSLLILVSPRQDNQNRGFIPCTQEMARGMMSCPSDGKMVCFAGYVLKNVWCDVRVIGRGIKLWVKGEQPAPWSNYIFTPDLRPLDDEGNPVDDEELQEFYRQNPDMRGDMQKLMEMHNKLNEELDNDKEK